jgi:enamine deaminase RidA (YjgF/YER057c/UK114 family)
MDKRLIITSGAPWEDIVGYSRAVRMGNMIEISGTTAVNGEEIVGDGDLYLQTQYILQKIEIVLGQCGGQLKDVVRTRMYVTDISQWEQAAKAHSEVFRNIKPVTTMVEVSKLISPKLLIEIEATAIIQIDV